MTSKEAIKYLRSTGMSEEQIFNVVSALHDNYDGYMTEHETFCKLLKIAKEHENIIIEICNMGLKLRWYGYIDGNPHNYIQLFSFTLVQSYGLEKCVKVFEIRLEEEKNRIFRGEVNE